MTTTDESYMKFAKCKSLDTNLFFADDVIGTNKAIAFCQTCPVKVPCGQYAMDNNIIYGVWGGLSIRARAKIKREQKQFQTV